MLKQGDRVGIVACSNGLQYSEKDQLGKLEKVLESFGLVPEMSPYIFRRESVFGASGRQRAEALNEMVRDDGVKAVFDISGGDIANEVLDYLDFELMQKHPKPFFGYSDLTTVINAIFTKAKIPAYLYQVRCLVRDDRISQQAAFQSSLFNGKDDLFCSGWEFIRGSRMEGIVVGGNVRCFLKLAGTPYMPDFTGKLLFLESYGGGAAQMTAYLSQLKQTGAFDRIAGLLLGTFTKMETARESPTMTKLACDMAEQYDFPIAKTHDVGHADTSKCLMIGTGQSFSENGWQRL